MSEVDAREAKRALRAAQKARRAGLFEAHPEAATALLQHLPPGLRPRVVSGTTPMGSELDPRPLMRHLAARGAQLALPRTPPRGQPLTFHVWTEETRFAPGRFGLDEPAADTPALVPDLVLVPLLAFDGAGRRLGSGGGYYDATLRALRAAGPVFALGVAFSGQQVDAVPCEAFDEPLDAVLTEAGWLEVAPLNPGTDVFSAGEGRPPRR
ncbi:MAG: 5-formyltetrahydrofolate cyclo-ligase [Myxococcaceae bacterium]|nr:5-formyltetrahydrofolate cyclo-ligase [Myxococcaceae bacterium]MCA3015958.1 5-formyltetrahydrofolate cyclo-ligase [Myxococcaceae bacterium]